ncbi:MAG: hypothetical protein GY795_43355 [Desulfobacterales bacterium]|nr:hypothetical protein [Desulfobacterales bacterium]
MTKSVKVKAAFYAINGTGLGHISRLLNIARSTKHLLNAMGIKADFNFITTTEAPQVAWDFPVYKIPSKTIISETDTSDSFFYGNAQFFNSNLTALLRPDLLVMDTMPQGAFNEFLSLRNFAKRTVFINRHKNEQYSSSPTHLSHLQLYDLIITPDFPSEEKHYNIPENIKDRNVFSGVVHGYEKQNAWQKENVHKYFGVKDNQTFIYISAGGGGDKKAQENLHQLIKISSDDPENFILAGYGPLFRGDKIYKPNVIPFTDPDVKKFFKGFDIAISAAGYNTYQELLAAKIPTIFFSQEKGMDCQELRIDTGVKRGWNKKLNDFSEQTILSSISVLKNPKQRAVLMESLNKREQSDGRLTSAVELLKLHSSIKGSPVDYREIFMAAQSEKEWQYLKSNNLCKNNGIDFSQAYSIGKMWMQTTTNAAQQYNLSDKSFLAWEMSELLPSLRTFLEIGYNVGSESVKHNISKGRLSSLLKQIASDTEKACHKKPDSIKKCIQNMLISEQ